MRAGGLRRRVWAAKRFAKNAAGVTSIEYGVIAAIMAVTIFSISSQVQEFFNSVVEAFSQSI